jgi:hypothetical protein
MKKPNITTASGVSIFRGKNFVLDSVDDELLFGLPSEDVESIRKQVGKLVKVLNIENNKLIEVEFVDESNAIHSIWVSAYNLTPSQDSQ